MNYWFMIYRFCTCLSLLFVICYPLCAQNNTRLFTREVERKENYFSRQVARIPAHQLLTVETGFSATGVVLRISHADRFEDAYLIVEQDTFYLTPDEHQPSEIKEKQSDLLIFTKPVQSFGFFPGSIHDSVSFHFYNGKTVKINAEKDNRKLRKKANESNCQEPESIDQQVWREGLPPPSYTRSFNRVSHLIVHHAATSNHLTDYVNIVRNIYLWHTQTNGWSDIGYNYLIAPDGTIFKGRDPGTGAQDDVKGAHFCGQNSDAMGVCLLGTYTEVEPADTMISALLKLLSWKAEKENLDPLEFSSHPANASLGAIAGHRDGCATECPGERVYARMDAFRKTTAAWLQSPVCGKQDTLLVDATFQLYPVPAEKELMVQLPDTTRIEIFEIYSLQGQLMSVTPELNLNRASVDVSRLPTGMYVVRIVSDGLVTERKIIIR